ncbi:hypothetical protein DYB32_000686 [Aphanomyces invadans]|uniref:F-BAR domain-containing protein n=1 Tax=Aphanomyces invadans TaxID=157072 RepID=A0A3R6YG78_9STRA|nr:hypothetical protein DYB32_000686 [Aphanomyces invadans]
MYSLTNRSVKTEDWAKHVANTWNTFHHTIAAISLEYAEFSNMHTSSIVSGMKACTSQQESQIQRLITEGTKLRTQYIECMNKLTKAKERYERKCAEAIETIQTIRRPPVPDAAEKVDIFSKVWDNTTKGLGLGSMERQKQKITACLDEVLSSEDAYIRAVDTVNTQYDTYERQVHDNLMAFEVTEEQRLEYIKDLLVRSEKVTCALAQSAYPCECANIRLILLQEFGSLLAEPVSLSLDTMKTEYIETKLRMEEQLQVVMASVSNEMAIHAKLEQKFEAKTKELAATKASLAYSAQEKDAMLQSDIKEFIQHAQVPWQARDRIVPALHGNIMLANELKAHEKTPPKLARALSSLSIRTLDDVKDGALNDKKPTADDAPKDELFGHSDLQKNFNVIASRPSNLRIQRCLNLV